MRRIFSYLIDFELDVFFYIARCDGFLRLVSKGRNAIHRKGKRSFGRINGTMVNEEGEISRSRREKFGLRFRRKKLLAR